MSWIEKEIPRKYRRRVENALNDIVSCDNCEYHDGDIMWLHGDPSPLSDLLYDYEIPEKYHDTIAKNISCPFCGREYFELYEDIGLKTKYDKDLEVHIAAAKKKYGVRLNKLKELLVQYPFLALSNSIAKEIYHEIDANTLGKISIEGRYYRCRMVERSEVLDSSDMLIAPLGKSGEGRFNHSGQPHLYISDTKETAISEACYGKKGKHLVWIQEIDIDTKIDNILDLSFPDWDFSITTNALLIGLLDRNHVYSKENNIENFKPDYRLTRFIMDCARKAGYNGIKYSSLRNFLGNNIVIFDKSCLNVKPIGVPYTEIVNIEDNDKLIHTYNDEQFGDI